MDLFYGLVLFLVLCWDFYSNLLSLHLHVIYCAYKQIVLVHALVVVDRFVFLSLLEF